jgi:hypothetical protein
MPGKNPCLNPLASRKQLLIAESELNRAHLVQEWRAISGEVHALAIRARTISSIVSVGASLVAGLAALRRKNSAPAEKPSWLQFILKGAGQVSALWLAFRAQTRYQKEK